MEHRDAKAKILLLDVESTPNVAYVWGKWEQNVLGDFIRERQIICFAWKWLGEKDTHVLSLPMFPRNYRQNMSDNSALIQKLHKLISEADIVVGHNVDKFDDKIANTDFIINGLVPPPPHRTVDTLKVARTKFGFNSNKLDDLGVRLGLGRKLKHTGFSLWVGCIHGDPKSWRMMEQYNKQDVVLLEKIYLKLRPWMTNHPTVWLKESCPSCGSNKVQSRGFSILKSLRRRRFSCECGQWFSGTKKEA